MSQGRIAGVAGQFVADIASGAIRPGDAIREQHDDVSQGTVREALIDIEHWGLVQRIRNKKTIVVNPTKQDVADRIEVWIPLEALACKLARPVFSQPIGPDLYRDLQELIHNIPRLDDAERQFHDRLWRCASNPSLHQTLSRLTFAIFTFHGLFRRKGFQSSEARVRSSQELLDVLSSAADDEAVEAVVKAHIRNAYVTFLLSDCPDLRTLAELPDIEHAAPRRSVSRHREFLRWVPTPVAIRDQFGRYIYKNHAMTRLHHVSSEMQLPSAVPAILSSSRNPLGDLIVVSSDAVLSRRLMTVRFAIPTNETTLIGEVGVDITDVLPAAELKHPYKGAIDVPPPSLDSREVSTASDSMLSAFFRWLPAVATWKDKLGRLLWANAAYERITGKLRDDAIGRSAAQNWPGTVGKTIADHDALVRDTRAPYLTTDHLDFRQESRCRVTIRFPTFDDQLQMQDTATMGISYGLVRICDDMIRLAERDRLVVLSEVEAQIAATE